MTVTICVAQNEEIFEKCVSLYGLVFPLNHKTMKKYFLIFHSFLDQKEYQPT